MTMCGRASTASGLQYDAIGAQRAGDVLQILLAHIVDGDLDLTADLLISGGRKADAAGLGDGFQARGDVDAVAEDVVAVGQHVADIDADAELDPPLGRLVGGCCHATLHSDGATHRVDDTGELDQQPVARGLDDAAPMSADFGVDQLPAQDAQPRQSPLLVIADEPAVAGDIGRQDGGDPPRRGSLAIGRPPTQYALDPRQELARLERLGDVVVGAGLQPDDPVHRIGGRSDHDNADVAALFAQPARQCEPVLAWQVDVEQYQRRRFTLNEAAQRSAAIDGADLEILPGEIVS